MINFLPGYDWSRDLLEVLVFEESPKMCWEVLDLLLADLNIIVGHGLGIFTTHDFRLFFA